MHNWIWRMKATLRRKQEAASKAEEMETHFAMEVEVGLRAGLQADEARRRARLHAGLVSEGMEAAREEIGFRWVYGTAADLRHAWRSLTRNRAFGTVAVAALAASVAINTLIFCILDGVILRPLPYRAPEQLVRIYDAADAQPKFAMAIGRFIDYRATARSIASMAMYTGNDMVLTASQGQSRQLKGLGITTDYFAVLGASPLLGRSFTDADLHGGVNHAIISYQLWKDRFQSDPAIIGKAIRLDREPWTVVGVAPRGFQHVGGEYRSPLQGETVDVWIPLVLEGREERTRAYHFCNVIARVRDGFSTAQAREELNILAARYSARYADYGKWGARVEPLLSEVTGRSRQIVWLLAAAGLIVLLVTCANIAGLCVARAISRRKELSLRRALGANRWQLLRVGLAENLLIGAVGAMLGLLLARIGLPLLHHLLPEDFPRAHEIRLTAMSGLFAAGIAIGTAVLAGLLPLVTSPRALESQRVTANRDSRKLRTALVAAEVALAGLLCAGALFLLHSFRELGARDHGFNPAGALTFQITAPVRPSTKPGDISRLEDRIIARIEQVPGVAAVGATTNLPWSGYDENSNFEIVGRTNAPNGSFGARYQGASPGYFPAAGMRLLDGRFFDQARDARDQPPVVMVNDAFVSRYFPDGKAVGAELGLAGSNRRIVGVVGSIQDSPADLAAKPAFWFPLDQMESASVFSRYEPSARTPERSRPRLRRPCMTWTRNSRWPRCGLCRTAPIARWRHAGSRYGCSRHSRC